MIKKLILHEEYVCFVVSHGSASVQCNIIIKNIVISDTKLM